MSKRGLPTSVSMRHDSHYVEELVSAGRSIGKRIKIDRIAPNPDQPRREIGDLTELSASISEKGVLEPLLVKPISDGTYMIIAGERRWQASKLAGLTEVPCIEMDLDEKGIAEIALIENLQRKDLTIWEEADGLRALADKFDYKHEDIAKKISKSRSTVTELLTVAGIPKDIRTRCLKANINSKSNLLEIARQFDEAGMYEALERFESGSTVKKAKSEAKPKASLAPKNDSKASADANSTFTYSSSEFDFKLTLAFGETQVVNRTSILKALKEAFESIKTGATEV